MTIYVAPGATFEANVSGTASGQVGTIGVRITNLATDVDFLARTTAGIQEFPASSGIYSRSFTAPTTAATYSIIWDTGSPPYATEDLVVTSTAPGASVPGGQDLCTLANVKAAIGIPTSTTTSDGLIQTVITAASRAITSKYQREFCPMGTLTRTFEVVGDRIELAPFDLLSTNATTGLSLYSEAVSPLALTRYTDFDLKPVGASILGTYTSVEVSGFLVVTGQSVFRYGYANLNITGVWGPAAIPVDVARAAALTAAAWIDRGADQIADYDSTARPDGSTFAASWAIPTAAHNLLMPYARVSYA